MKGMNDFMRMNLKQCFWIIAMILIMGITVGTVQVMGSPSPQDQHERDYSTDKNYKLGMRDARDDDEHRRDHFKKRKFKADADRQAYEAGYQAGHQGNRQEQ